MIAHIIIIRINVGIVRLNRAPFKMLAGVVRFLSKQVLLIGFDYADILVNNNYSISPPVIDILLY